MTVVPDPPRRRGVRAVASALAALALAGTLAGCTGDDDNSVSVFAVKPGQCFSAPKSVTVQLSSLSRTDCTKPHTLEAYAVVEYRAPGTVRTAVPSVPKKPSGVPTAVPTGVPSAFPTAVPSLPSNGASVSLDSSYPGTSVLKTFADGVCAQRFGPYVGVDYLDSTLFYTYLLPSARSWDQSADRNVLCFVTTTGGTLKESVKGSRR